MSGDFSVIMYVSVFVCVYISISGANGGTREQKDNKGIYQSLTCEFCYPILLERC